MLSRRAFIRAATVPTAAALVLGTTERCEAANASWPPLRTGDVLLTRLASWNVVPGFYNHSAMYDGQNVIEAQIGGNAVKKTTLGTFYNTYPTIVVLRHVSVKTAPVTTMGQYATSLVGQKYVSISGWFPLVYSCVSLIRVCYMRGFAVDPGFKIPDHIYNSSLFRVVGWK